MDISETVEVKGHEKCIFETPHNEIKCVLSVKESNFNEKKDQNFHICLRSALCEKFFGVFFILDYDSMCSETNFTQEKVIF